MYDVIASLKGLPAFLAYFSTALGLLLLFGVLYVQLTPHREFQLIKANQPAAAVAFGGALLGFTLPLAAAMGNAVSLGDFAIWAALAMVVQILVFLLLRLSLPGLSQRIADGELASALFVAFVAVSVGILNAASMG